MIGDGHGSARTGQRMRDGDMHTWAGARPSWSLSWQEEEGDESNGVGLGADGPSLWEAELEALWEAEAEGRFVGVGRAGEDEEIHAPMR